MKKWVVLHKNVGQTPLEVLETYRNKAQLPQDVPLAYAGRLDPMADGKLLVLIGDECKRQERYFNLDKAYTFRILLGFTSDTGDILGLATPHLFKTRVSNNPVQYPDIAQVQEVLQELLGEQSFPYPRFSSKTVQGKPLHMWTLEGKLDEITIPTKTSTIYSLSLISINTVEKDVLEQDIFSRINSFPEVTDPRKALGQDFRRSSVRKQWERVFIESTQEKHTILTVQCEATSGTYMRTLAEIIGERLGTGGLAFSITRTKIGRRLPFLPLWYSQYK